MKRRFTAIVIAALLAMAGVTSCSSSGNQSGGETITWYSGWQATDAQPIVDAFKKKTGISVSFYTGTTASLWARVQQEVSAGRPTADVYSLTSLDFVDEMKKNDWVNPMPQPIVANFPKRYQDPDGYWFSSRVTVIPIVYNTQRVTGGDIPQTWQDLLKPLWSNGKIVLGSAKTNNTNFISAWQLGQAFGDQYLTDLGKQQPGVLQHSGDQVNAVISGQYDAAVMSDDAAWPQIVNGAPVAVSYPKEGVPNYIDYNVIMKTKNGNADGAAKFSEFLASEEGGRLTAQTGAYSTVPGVPPQPPQRPALDTLNLMPSAPDVVRKWVAGKADYLQFLATSVGDR